MTQQDGHSSRTRSNRAERHAAAMLALPAVWHLKPTRPGSKTAQEMLPECYVPGAMPSAPPGTGSGEKAAGQAWPDVSYPLPVSVNYGSNAETGGTPRDCAGLTGRARPRAAIGTEAGGTDVAVRPTKARGRVLVVDDDADVGRVVAVFLRKAGFEVVVAASSDAALAVMRHADAFHVLVTDYAMLGINGVELVLLTREAWQDIGALVVTGYAGAEGLSRLPPETVVLRKPFKRAVLVRHVGQLTDRADVQPVSIAVPATVDAGLPD